MATHHLDDKHPHPFWDNAHPPRLRIRPGDTVVFETLEGGGQVTPDWTDADLARRWANDTVHALTGPVYVEGAEPGDALVVEVLDLQHKGWGWNCVLPGLRALGRGSSRATTFTTTRWWEATASSDPASASPSNPSAG